MAMTTQTDALFLYFATPDECSCVWCLGDKAENA